MAVSRYHGDVTEPMAAGSASTFLAAGGLEANLRRVDVAGAWELIAICRAMAFAEHRPDAIVAIGCVITGETTHDQYINAAVSQSLSQIIVQTGVPISFGLLTCQSIEQALTRAGGEKGNKGAEAMVAAIEAAATIISLPS